MTFFNLLFSVALHFLVPRILLARTIFVFLCVFCFFFLDHHLVYFFLFVLSTYCLSRSNVNSPFLKIFMSLKMSNLSGRKKEDV